MNLMKDSVMNTNPFLTITAKDINDDITILDAYLIIKRDYRKNDPKATVADLDRMYGRLRKNGRTDFVLIQYFTFDNLTVDISKFQNDSIVNK